MPNPPAQKPSQQKQSPRRAGPTPGPMASAINPEFLERYQIELQKNPRSRVFAPLAEAYRKMGMIPEALRICRVGVGANPDFSGGLVAYAKILIETSKFDDALTLLRKATTISPDNLLAHTLMGDALLELRKPKDALKAFKMVLFLNPEDEKAKSTVRKWEFLTADEFDDEEFAMRPLFEQDPNEESSNEDREENADNQTRSHSGRSRTRLDTRISEAKSRHGLNTGIGQKSTPADSSRLRAKELERALSLADAFTVRNDLAAALETLERAERTLGTSPDITNRLAMLARRTQVLTPDSEPRSSHEREMSEEKELNLDADDELDFEEENHQSPSIEDDEDDEEESFTMSRVGQAVPRLNRNSEAHSSRGGLQARIDEVTSGQRPSSDSGSRGLQRRVAKLETLLHRISERRLD